MPAAASSLASSGKEAEALTHWRNLFVLLAMAWTASAASESDGQHALIAGRQVIGRSVEGRPIEVLSYGSGPETILIIASIHGSEPAGTFLVDALVDWLETTPTSRRVVIVPRANPDGFARQERHNARGVDLNRNFPADNHTDRHDHGTEPLSEPEAVALHRLILDQSPDVIVSIHQFFACVDYDGPASALAHRMSKACGLLVKKLGTQPGSLGAWAGEHLGIATITLELPEGVESQTSEDLWQKYGGALRTAIESP